MSSVVTSPLITRAINTHESDIHPNCSDLEETFKHVSFVFNYLLRCLGTEVAHVSLPLCVIM